MGILQRLFGGAGLSPVREFGGPVTALAASATRVAAAAKELEEVVVFDPGSGLRCGGFRGEGSDLAALTLLADGGPAASARKESTSIALWDAGSGQKTRELARPAAVTALGAGPSGELLVGHADGSLALLDAGVFDERLRLAPAADALAKVFEKPSYAVTVVALSPTGDHAAGIVGGVVMVWDLRDGHRDVAFHAVQNEAFNTVAFSPCGRFVAATGGRFSIRINVSAGASAIVTVSDLSGCLWLSDLRSGQTWHVETAEMHFDGGWWKGDDLCVLGSAPPVEDGLGKEVLTYAVDAVQRGDVKPRLRQPLNRGRGPLRADHAFVPGPEMLVVRVGGHLHAYSLKAGARA